MKIEIWKAKGARWWYWHFKAGNGEITANAEPYPSRAHAVRGGEGQVRSIMKPTGVKPKFLVKVNPDGARFHTVITWS